MSHPSSEVRACKVELVVFAAMALCAWRFPAAFSHALQSVYAVLIVALAVVLVVLLGVRVEQYRARRRRRQRSAVVIPLRR